MGQEPEKKTSEGKAHVNSAERLSHQTALVGKLAADYEKNPSGELEAELKRKSDMLFHLVNVVKSNPRERARRAAESAKRATLDRAIKQ